MDLCVARIAGQIIILYFLQALLKLLNISHVLFRCSLASQVWSATNLPLPSHDFTNSVAHNIEYALSLKGKPVLDPQFRSVVPWLLWEIWKARNALLYAAKATDHHFVIANALDEAEEWIKQNQITSQ